MTCARGFMVFIESTPFIIPLLTSDPRDNKRKLNSVRIHFVVVSLSGF